MNKNKICNVIRYKLENVMENMRKVSCLDELKISYGETMAYLTMLDCFGEDTEALRAKIAKIAKIYQKYYNKLNYFTFELAGKKYKAEINNKKEIEKLLTAFNNGNISNELLSQWTDFLVKEEIEPVERN